MKIKFLGAAGTVTGSGYVVTSESGSSILVDLGMFQGPSAIEKLNYQKIDYDLSKLSGAVLTHAHLDHCGRIPVLLSHGFKSQIWMTSPTADLTEISLFDSAKIARMDGREILYDRKLVEKTLKAFRKTSYGTTILVGHFGVTFRDAGHILGSASIEIEDKSASGQVKKSVFSGDLGNPDMDLLPSAAHIHSSDVVVMESTYGGRLHPVESPQDVLAREVNAAESSGSTLLMPTFSLEKTQEILHWFKFLKQKGLVKSQTPVFLDSPMAVKATRVYENYSYMFSSQIQQEFKISNPFDFPGLTMIESRETRGSLEKSSGAKVIMAGSGMMMGGRILMHAQRYLTNRSARLLILGYQGEETLGREILEGARSVNIDGATITIKATVSHTESMSSHADQGQLLSWLKNISGTKHVVLTHGDDTPRKALGKIIETDFGTKVSLPILNQEITL